MLNKLYGTHAEEYIIVRVEVCYPSYNYILHRNVSGAHAAQGIVRERRFHTTKASDNVVLLLTLGFVFLGCIETGIYKLEPLNPGLPQTLNNVL